MKFGTPLASPAVAFTSGQWDSLGSSPVSGAAGAFYYFTALNSYSTIVVQAYGGATAIPIACQATNTTQAADTGLGSGAGYFQWSSAFPRFAGSGQSGSAPMDVILPFYCVAGDDIQVLVIFNSAPSAGPNSYITVWGLTDTTPPPFRADGRVYPQGLFHVNQTANNGTGTLIAAGASPIRIMLKSINANISGTGQCFVTATSAGGNGALFIGAAGITSFNHEWESGLLLDAATPVTLTSQASGATVYASAVYDYTL